MEYQGIILTGTSGSGKTTLSRFLQNKFKSFKQVKALTTRSRRDDDSDDYIYISQDKLEKMRKEQKLIIHAEYNDSFYGITYDSIDEVVGENKVPILIITPDSIKEISQQIKYIFLSYFIDEDDDELNKRLAQRKEPLTDRTSILSRRKRDRQFIDSCIYYIQNQSLDQSCELINTLWEFRQTGGILSKRIIELMVSCGVLIRGASSDNMKGASYDLSLGDEYYYKGKILNMSNVKPFIKIEPYDYIIATSKELINFPRDITGRFDLAVSLFCQGVILSNGPCVDPGFRGRLFCLLFNTSNETISLKRGQHYATLEMNKLIEPTEGYSGKYQDKDKISDYLPSNSLQGGINELKKEVEELKQESKSLQTALLGFISLMVAVISLWLIIK